MVLLRSTVQDSWWRRRIAVMLSLAVTCCSVECFVFVIYSPTWATSGTHALLQPWARGLDFVRTTAGAYVAAGTNSLLRRTKRQQVPYELLSPKLTIAGDANHFLMQSTCHDGSRGASSTAGTRIRSATTLSPLESWCVLRLEQTYRKALSHKCPFLRRRATDLLDSMDSAMRFGMRLSRRRKRHALFDASGTTAGLPSKKMARTSSLSSQALFLIGNDHEAAALDRLLGPPPSLRGPAGKAHHKLRGLSLEQLAEIVRQDWKPKTNKGYYITGRLNTTIYRNDCFFDGPDPDMPVHGLRKYLNAASQLFDQHQSRSQLLSLEVVPEQHCLRAAWKMHGTLRLPWHPVLPEWTGTTWYHVDSDGLIAKHTETWDLSVWQAFLRTFCPSLACRIWGSSSVPRGQPVNDQVLAIGGEAVS